MVHFNAGRRSCYGQATLEYALVTSALLAVLIAFGVMFHACNEVYWCIMRLNMHHIECM